MSPIVLWELAKLIQLGRLDMSLDDREVVRILSRLHVWPIDLTVALTESQLVDNDWHFTSGVDTRRGQPADRVLARTRQWRLTPVATAR